MEKFTEKFNEIPVVSKVKTYIAVDENKKQIKKIVIIVLAVIGACVLIGGGIYLFLRLTGRIGHDDDYDLYDDLDNYYDEDDEETEAKPQDFAE